MKYLLFILTVGLLTACTSKNTAAITEVENLTNEVNLLQEQFNSVDNEAIANAKKQYDESMFLIKKYYFKDTIDLLFMNNLDYYKNIKYSSKVLNKNKHVIAGNFEISKQQLTSLKEDLTNSVIDGERLKEALANEKNNVALLDSTVKLYLNNVEVLLNVHDSLAGYIKNKSLSF